MKEGEIPKEEDRNERQKIRYDVLAWRKEKDCPSRAQLHPELNQWPPVNKDSAEQVRSCKVDPPSKTRPKGPSEKRSGDKRKMDQLPMIVDFKVHDNHVTKEWDITIPVNDTTNPPELVMKSGFWELIQYKSTKTPKTNVHATTSAAAVEDEEEEDDI